ncbi:MAG: hypothetical protein V3U24_00355, partial [Candidatus Neomarinimicrobiota bacterium]
CFGTPMKSLRQSPYFVLTWILVAVFTIQGQKISGPGGEGTEEAQVRDRPLSLRFTESDWDIPRSVTLYGLDDDIGDGDQVYTVITGPVVSDDTNYHALDPLDVSAVNVDDDWSGIVAASHRILTTTEAGGTDTFSLVLTSQPAADVTVFLSSSDSMEETVSPSSITFTGDNWNVAQRVTVTGDSSDGEQIYGVGVGPAISDDDKPGILLSTTTGLTTVEGASSASFMIRLASEPLAEVTIPLKSSNSTEGAVSPSSVVFTRDDWEIDQGVTVTGLDDDENDGNQPYSVVVEAAVSEDAGYNGIDAADVTVTNMDDDGPGIIVNVTEGLTTTEAGGESSFMVWLASQPTADVQVTLRSSDQTEGSLWPPQGSHEGQFPPSDWPERIRGWMVGNYRGVLVGAVVGGGAAAWILLGNEEQPVILTPEFPRVP